MAILVRVNSLKFISLQCVAAHSYMAVLIRGVIRQRFFRFSTLRRTLNWQLCLGGKSSEPLPLQPIPADSNVAIFVRVIPQNSSHCSPLQRNRTWQIYLGSSSSKILPLPQIAALSFRAIFLRGGGG